MAENEQADGASTTDAPRGNKFKFIVIVVGVLAVLGGAGAGYFFFFGHNGGEEKHVGSKTPIPKNPAPKKKPALPEGEASTKKGAAKMKSRNKHNGSA